MNETIALAVVLGLTWLATLLLAYTAGARARHEDGREIAESNRIEDLIEKENNR